MILNFSITHFIGSFDYTIHRDDLRGKVVFIIVNDTTLESGTRLPPPIGINPLNAALGVSVEEIIEEHPELADEPFHQVVEQFRGSVFSILRSRPRGEGIGGGNMWQLYAWEEDLLSCNMIGWPFTSLLLNPQPTKHAAKSYVSTK